MIKNRTKFIFLILVITVGFAAYSNSLTNEFLWDDELLVINNKYIKDLRNTPALFTKNITYSTNIESNLYRPLQILTYTLNYAVWKLDVRAYHLTNIVLHILVAIMLYWLTQLLAKNEVLSLITALLFISHPIHTEAVTYISGRADPLAALFMLSSVIFYVKYSDNRNKLSLYFLSIVLYLFALLSKEIALILPVLLITYDYIYREQKRFSFRPHLPFFLLALSYIALRKTIFNFPVSKTVIDRFTFFERIPAVFKSLTMYFEKLLIPLNLHMEYQPIAPQIRDIRVITGIVIATMLILTVIICRKKAALVSFSIAWLLINYLPVSNVYPLNAFFAEHWIYVPCLGLFILGAWIAVKLCEKGQIVKWLACLVLAFLLVCNFHLTMKQNQYWSNPEDFYRRTLQYSPHSSRVYFRLGLLYFRKAMVDKGIEVTKKSLEINPAYLPAYENLAAGYIMKGSYDEAADICEKVLKIKPSSAQADRLLELLEPLR